MKKELENQIRVLEVNINKLYEADEKSRKVPMTEITPKQQQDNLTGAKENDNDNMRKVK